MNKDNSPSEKPSLIHNSNNLNFSTHPKRFGSLDNSKKVFDQLEKQSSSTKLTKLTNSSTKITNSTNNSTKKLNNFENSIKSNKPLNSVNSSNSVNLIEQRNSLDQIENNKFEKIKNNKIDLLENNNSVKDIDNLIRNRNSNRMFKKFKIPSNRYLTVAVLTFANILNYIERYVIFAILPDIKKYYSMNDKQYGLLQTAFVVCYITFSFVFGAAGDKFSQKWIIIFGLVIWAFASLIGSYIPENHLWAFFLTRCFVGIGEAGLSTLGFPLISKLFNGSTKTTMLSIFMIAIPLGNGIGYLFGSLPSSKLQWKTNLRITPYTVFGAILLAVLFIVEVPTSKVVKNIEDEESNKNNAFTQDTLDSDENKPLLNDNQNTLDLIDSNFEFKKSQSVESDDVNIYTRKKTSSKKIKEKIKNNPVISKLHFLKAIWNDLLYLFKIPSFVLTQVGYSLSSLVVCGISVWLQTFIRYSNECRKDDIASTSFGKVSIVFGVCCLVFGILGVFIGGFISTILKKNRCRTADVLICSFANIFCCIPVFIALVMSFHYLIVTWVFFIMGVFILCITWTPNSEILLGIVAPNKIGFAAAVQILAMHGLGDALGPFIIGWISDFTRTTNDSCGNMKALYNALLFGPFFIAFSGLFYIFSLIYYERDLDKKNSQDVY